MYIILKANNEYRGHTDNPSFDLSGLGSGAPFTLLEVTNTIFSDLMEDLQSGKKMKWDVGTGAFVECDDLPYLKDKKIEAARTYYETRKTFSYNSTPCWMDRSVLRNFYTDILIQKRDVELNSGSACGSNIQPDSMNFGSLSGISLSLAEETCIKVRCYMRAIDAQLTNHISAIQALTTSSAVNAYNVEASYPVILSFSSGGG